MDKKVIRKTAIIRELVLNQKLQKEIAQKHNVSEGYVSQIIKKIKQLINPPKIINGKIVCFKCEQEGNSLDFHHSISCKGFIAIVCHSCNVKLGQNYLNYKGEEPDVRIVSAEINNPLYEDAYRLARIQGDKNISQMIIKLLEIITKNAKRKGIL